MRQVFISYSSKDFAQAKAVRNVLEQNGITCWMAPESIPGGSNYTKEIPIAIRNCQAFVLMLSDNAQKSHWVLKELDSAVNEGKIILPFQLEDVPLSDEFNFLLTGAQRYDAYQRKAEALNLLVTRIRAIIGSSAPETEPSPPQPEPQAPKKKIEIPVFQKPKKEEPKHTFSSCACPACGSLDVAEFPDRISPRTLVEQLLYRGLSVGMVLATPIALVVVAAILITIVEMFVFFLDPAVLDAIWIAVWVLMIPAMVLAYGFGKNLAGTWISRQRIRKHIKVTECRCNTCQKKFQSVENQ